MFIFCMKDEKLQQEIGDKVRTLGTTTIAFGAFSRIDAYSKCINSQNFNPYVLEDFAMN
jgi:hypothetical protein